MPIFSKESLENLRQRIDLLEVISSHVEMKKTGGAYKGLCPFHDEKSPSFIIQKGDTHYHCFGCGAHGDAIQFLMTYQKLNFSDAIESLAQRFHVHLEKVDGTEEKSGPNKQLLKEALLHACQFYQFCLLHTAEGEEALNYLYQRGIDLDFIQQFQIGLAPKAPGVFRKAMQLKHIRDDTLLAAGLIATNSHGQTRDFFSERIMFPIHQYSGEVIGFSGRKYKEATFGGKYVNTPETSLFKKSRVLFGFNYSRKRMMKERKAIIVEGQIDALRLIHEGFDITVAGQGTAFGEGHVQELVKLGVHQVFLALDSDKAGEEATVKIGHLFQKEGVESRIISLPYGEDPDTFLRNQGKEAFLAMLETSSDYLSFLVKHLSKGLNLDSPAAKNEVIQNATKIIREWNHPVMVHETLRKLAHQMKVPENYVGVGLEVTPNIYVKKNASIGTQTIDPDRILETDLLRWMCLLGQEKNNLIELVSFNLIKEDLHVPVCQKLFEVYFRNYRDNRPSDLLSLAIDSNDDETQLLMTDLMQKKVNKDRAEEQLTETIQKILNRNWMEKREAIKMRIQSGQCSDEEINVLIKEFDDLKRSSPQVKALNGTK
ncbi:MAG: DNA primase [Parachlamydiaceae bacterium]|nr:DNA primase [Parachlamydiaceae bacterium]